MKRIPICFFVLLFAVTISGCKISGTITDRGQGIDGVTVTLSGGVAIETTTDQNGYYKFDFSQSASSRNSYTVTPVKDGYNFFPESKVVQFTMGASTVEKVDFIAEMSQRQALIEFYNSTGGDQWLNNEGWKTPPLASDGFAMPGTENSWYGIEYDEVKEAALAIRLSENGLTGFLPDSLGVLSDLIEIDLSINQIKGAMPTTIGALQNLQSLILSNNNLEGYIPVELMGMSALQNIDIIYNHLCTQDPALIDFLDMKSPGWALQKIDTVCQPARQILMALYEATNGPNWTRNRNWGSDAEVDTWYGVAYRPYPSGALIILDLADNNLVGTIPVSTCELTNLGVLELSRNQLSGPIPECIGELTNLDDLDLSSNQLGGPIPESIGKLANLEFLDLSGNDLTGRIPTTILNLENLSEINLVGNRLCTEDQAVMDFLDIWTSEWDDWRAQRLDTECQPVRQILMEFYEATNGPNWTRNGGWGTDAPVETWFGVSHSYSQPPSFKMFIDENNLVGTIPASICELTNLGVLELSRNQLIGPIPECIGELTNLELLDLSSNELTGLIPTSIMNLKNLEEISLAVNHLCTEDQALKDFLDTFSSEWSDWQYGQTDTVCGQD